MVGGAAYAAIPAFLKTRFNTNEILTSLMLVYVAQLFLDWLVRGPWRNPQGMSFPGTIRFNDYRCCRRCCGHSHAAPQALEHAHVHKDGEGCCDHGHEHHHHDHEHDHKHDHEGEPHGHSHGILEESGAVGRLVAIFLLAVPLTYAAIKTPDEYSREWNDKKDTKQYGKGGESERFQKGVATPSVAAVSPAPAPVPTPGSAPAPSTAPSVTPGAPGTKMEDQPPGVVPPAVNPKEVERQATKTAEAKSYGNFTLADLKAQVPQSPEGNFMLEVPELYYTAGDKEVQSVLDGQPVETIAQVLPEKVNNEDGSRVRIFRLLVQCCAADARPYSIPVEFGKAAPAFKDMSWVKVIGKMTYKKEGDQIVPVLEATKMTETAEPANSMVY